MTRSILLASLLIGCSFVGSAVAQNSPEFGPPRDEIRDPSPTASDLEVEKAVERGLAQLAGMQGNDGAWRNDVGNKLGDAYQRNIDGIGKPHLGVTAIACMAFMAAGHTPDRGEYHRNVAAGLAFVLSNIDRDTGWVSQHGTRMYSHAFCSMFLAEVYGQTRDPVVLSHLRNAVRFIVESQNMQGAWRYIPNQADSDMSICVCQLQALRAAANVGVLVPDTAIEAAKDYVRKSYNGSSGFNGPHGSFKYQIDWDGRSTFALTAAGVVALQSMGEYATHTFSGPTGQQISLDLRRSIEFIRDYRPDRWENSVRRGDIRLLDYGFWYGHYYAAQAMYQYQYVNKRYWDEWNDKNRKHFLKLQEPNGAWVDEIGGFDREKNAYATAMACLILSIPRGYLPIFQN